MGVSIVALLTLLGSFGLGFLFLLFVALSAVGGGEVGGEASGYWWLASPFIVATLFLALYAFFLSIVMFVGVRSRLLWYASVLFWIVTAVFFILLESRLNLFGAAHYWGIRGWFLFASPYICSIGCLAYFQTPRVKEYFHILKVR